jgi:rubrerythrin
VWIKGYNMAEITFVGEVEGSTDLNVWSCELCGHEWESRIPSKCPNCKEKEEVNGDRDN